MLQSKRTALQHPGLFHQFISAAHERIVRLVREPLETLHQSVEAHFVRRQAGVDGVHCVVPGSVDDSVDEVHTQLPGGDQLGYHWQRVSDGFVPNAGQFGTFREEVVQFNLEAKECGD